MDKEYVGRCTLCDAEIYCHQGFLNGVIEEDHSLVCMSCHEEENK